MGVKSDTYLHRLRTLNPPLADLIAPLVLSQHSKRDAVAVKLLSIRRAHLGNKQPFLIVVILGESLGEKAVLVSFLCRVFQN